MEKFKPKKTEKTVVSIRMNNDLLQQIDLLSSKSEISRNELIIQCLEYALTNKDEN